MAWFKKVVVVILVGASALGIFILAFKAGGRIGSTSSQAIKEATDQEVSEMKKLSLDKIEISTADKDDESKKDWQKVENDSLSLSFKIPLDFVIWDDKPYGPASLTVASFEPEQVEPSDYFAPGNIKIEIYRVDKSSQTSLSEWLQSQPTEAEETKDKKLEVADRPAVLRIGVDLGAFISYYIDIGDGILVAIAYVNESEIDKQKKLFASIVDSFQFTKE